jgi:hypothetical protein
MCFWLGVGRTAVSSDEAGKSIHWLATRVAGLIGLMLD